MSIIDWSQNELRDSPLEVVTLDGAEVKRVCRVPWAQRHAAARELIGGIDSGVWQPPELYAAPGSDETISYVYAYKVEMRPYKERGDANDEAELTVYYKTVDYQGGNTWVTESLEPSSMFVTLDRKGLNFSSGADRVSLEANDLQAPAAIIGMVDWVYTINYLPAWQSPHFDLIGKVNNAAVASNSLLMTFPAETLLCRNPVARREIAMDGSYTWTVTYRFTYMNNGTIANPKGWNHMIRTDNADATGIKFERLTNDDGAEVPIYQLADFSGIIA